MDDREASDEVMRRIDTKIEPIFTGRISPMATLISKLLIDSELTEAAAVEVPTWMNKFP